jgi:hypothetical protein
MINKVKLHDCGVVFNAEHHTYTLDGKELSGITSIISKYIFPNMYSNVSESVLEAARERGSMVHAGLEAEFLGMKGDIPEIVAYRELAKQHKIKQIAAEYVVTDYNSIATCIDSVAYVNGELALLDYKTTSVLNIEYLRWQLSLESLMFTMVNQCSVAKAYAVHLPKPKDGVCDAKLVEIELIPCNHLTSLLDAFNAGSEEFINPLRNMGDDFESILEQYIQAEQALLDIRGIVAEYEKTQANCKEALKAIMDERKVSVWEGEGVKVTRSADQVRKTFDLKLLQEQCPKFPAKWMKEIETKGYKESVTRGRMTITLK